MPTSNWTTTLPTPAEGPILGIDPGTRFTGWGVIGGSAARPTRIAGGVIRLRSALPLADRLHLLQSELQEIVLAHEVAAAAVEAPFHGNNARSALTLAHARGVVLAVLAGAGLTVHEYSPATVKKSVTGNGRADKNQVRMMVSQLLGRAEESQSSDLADAWAVALCHASHRRVAARLAP
jgi:crossover junction endodeoxyribonuclease RuvC